MTPEQRRRSLAAAIALATIAGIGISMLYPLLALALEEMGAAARSLGATHIHSEQFDIRSGIGPEISLAVDGALEAARAG